MNTSLKYCKGAINFITSIRTNEEFFQSFLKCCVCCLYCKKYENCSDRCSKVLCDDKITYEAIIL